jgi:hypothetical protein
VKKDESQASAYANKSSWQVSAYRGRPCRRQQVETGGSEENAGSKRHEVMDPAP